MCIDPTYNQIYQIIFGLNDITRRKYIQKVRPIRTTTNDSGCDFFSIFETLNAIEQILDAGSFLRESNKSISPNEIDLL